MLGRGQPGQDRSGLRWIGAESGGLGWFRLDPHPILHQSNSIHPDPRVPEDSCASSGSSFTQSVGQHPQGHHSRSPFSATVRGFVRRRKEAGGRAPFPCGENDKKRERQDCISRWTPSLTTLSGQTHGHHAQLGARAQALVTSLFVGLYRFCGGWHVRGFASVLCCSRCTGPI